VDKDKKNDMFLRNPKKTTGNKEQRKKCGVLGFAKNSYEKLKK